MMPSMKIPSWKCLLYGVAFLIVLSWVYVACISFYPFKPLIIHGPIQILNENKQVVAGNDIFYVFKYIKKTNKPCQVTRQLVNHFVFTADSYISNVPETDMSGKVQASYRNLHVPVYAEAGSYRLYQTWTYQITDFPERNITIEAWSEPFTVLASKENKGEKGDPGATGKTGKEGKEGEKGKQGIQGVRNNF